jgi:hypothetical protein
VTDALAEDVVEGVEESEPVLEGLAPRVTDAVGVRESERESVDEPDGVAAPVGVPLPVGVAVGVPDAVTEDVAEGEELTVPLTDTLGVSLAVRDALRPIDTDAVCEGVALPVAGGLVWMEGVRYTVWTLGALLPPQAAPDRPNLSLTAWFSILVVVVLAEVFREGARLRREAELTI